MSTGVSRLSSFGHRLTVQQLLSSACAFLALTSVAGGIGLIVGAIQPGEELLRGSPFPSYSIPGLVLLVVVGGSALAATILLVIGHPAAASAAALAGVMMMCFELVEVWAIGSPRGLARNLQMFYFGLGAVIVGVALLGPGRTVGRRT